MTSSIASEGLRGRRVAFTATVTASDDDRVVRLLLAIRRRPSGGRRRDQWDDGETSG